MILEIISYFALFATAIASGLGYISFWWVLLPAFGVVSFGISNGPTFHLVMEANREGRLGYLPKKIALLMVPLTLSAALVWWIASLFR